MAKDPAYIRTITVMLMEAEPGLLTCDPVAVARASGSCAEVMGAMLASTLVMKGEATYLAALKYLVVKADEAARSTAREAIREIDKPSPETTNVN